MHRKAMTVCSSKTMAAESVYTLLQALLISGGKFSKPCMKTQQTQAANPILYEPGWVLSGEEL